MLTHSMLMSFSVDTFLTCLISLVLRASATLHQQKSADYSQFRTCGLTYFLTFLLNTKSFMPIYTLFFKAIYLFLNAV